MGPPEQLGLWQHRPDPNDRTEGLWWYPVTISFCFIRTHRTRMFHCVYIFQYVLSNRNSSTITVLLLSANTWSIFSKCSQDIQETICLYHSPLNEWHFSSCWKKNVNFSSFWRFSQRFLKTKKCMQADKTIHKLKNGGEHVHLKKENNKRGHGFAKALCQDGERVGVWCKC